MLACAVLHRRRFRRALKASCARRARPRRDTRSSVATTATRPTFGRTPNVGGVSGVRVPAKYDGFEGCRRRLPTPRRCRAPTPDGFVTLDVDISTPTTPAPPGGYPLIVFMHGCCAGDKNAWQRPDFGSGETLALQQRLVRVARLRGAELHLAGFQDPVRRRRLHRRDRARLPAVRDQRLPVPGGADRGRPVLQREPAEGGAHGRLLRRRFRMAGAHRPEVDEPRRQGHEAGGVGAPVRMDGHRVLADPERAPLAVPGRPAGIRRLGLAAPRSASRSRASTRSCTGRASSAPRSPRPSTWPSAACSRPSRSRPRRSARTRSTTSCPSSSTTAPPTTRTSGSRGSHPTRATGSRSSTPPRSPTRSSRRSRTCACPTGSRRSCPGYPIQQYFGDYQHFVQNKAKEWGDLCGADHHVCTLADYPGGDVNATPDGPLQDRRHHAAEPLHRPLRAAAREPERAAAAVTT